jgi:hypothetical protein
MIIGAILSMVPESQTTHDVVTSLMMKAVLFPGKKLREPLKSNPIP